MSDEVPNDPDQNLQAEPLSRAIGERYLTYALSTIMNRALPDARDGLKPVHRRILYAMRELRLAPNGAFRKSAKITGDVMGNYHPHGDAAIYDAMARLAQDFAMRYPLVDGQGNFGNIDGDNPAAARYTEARLAQASEALMDGLAENSVDFRANYDGTLTEPVVLPAAFPNLLANGASGIAVGMATNIPPHNLHELIDACLHLIKTPEARDDTLAGIVQGPDFPTGGVIVESRESIAETYRTGRGAFRVRAKWEQEDLGRGQWQVVVTEIPYQVQKSRLIERLAELIQTRKIPILADVRDESAEDIRIVLEPRTRAVDPEQMMAALFRVSDLEIRFSLNMNVLIDGRVPRVCSLKEVLRAFLDHRREVLIRRANFRLDRIAARLEVLEGYLVAYLNLDRVIEIIRYEEDPKRKLMQEDWSGGDSVSGIFLNEVQVEAILNMRLRALRKLEEIELRAERDSLLAEREELQTMLGDEAAQWARIADQMKEVRNLFGKSSPDGQRRTLITDAVEAPPIDMEAMIEREPLTVILSRMGWIRAMKGHQPLDAELKFRDGDGPAMALHAETTDKLMVFASNGRFYTLPANALPGGRGMGEPLRLMVDLPNEAEVIAMFPWREGRKYLVASKAGNGFIVDAADILAQTKTGKQVLNGDALLCKPVGGDHVAVVGTNRKMLVFPLADLPEMSRGKGVRLQRFGNGGGLVAADTLSDATFVTLSEGLSWSMTGGKTRTESDLGDWLGKRAGAGRMAPRGFPRNHKFD
ncbi:MAG: DNA topoisomerase IV subunit A [Paracoccus sp. (in: a-proteobacteria)]|uniref:DNA topoisomerase IV subunit A n=1 Tax=unclassified Paracoccus (in: a-proteobacteria) TaxID=2688777 RepID=UPI0025E80346|nr:MULTISPECIES: DNA topoisomerase IV subunit A [unclassified Paracoccus (in: a-proteobacteria)]MCS5603399.1 DNA topoisomerase IV subunit A [Paracoccus sp. (in: a-proteobacteria)]|tara:strand:+ start:2714 stop:4987 length:2274 start_codon:yes stop_codon:yes gene_type:complete